MVADLPVPLDKTDTPEWTARVLFSTRNDKEIDALLALRCGSSRPDMNKWYDERPAVIILTGESGFLRLVPVGEDCENCDILYHVGFSKTYSAAATRLLELHVDYSSDNPCCDGTDHTEGTRLVVVSIPEGADVLSMVQHTYEDSADDEADTVTTWVCDTKIDYDRDGADNVTFIRAEIHCAVDKKPQPDVKKRKFRWNPERRTFEEVNLISP
jgi:hypothetical protein